MHILLKKRSFHYGLAGVFLLLAMVLFWRIGSDRAPAYITATVERGTVSDIVSVSGFVEAENSADLAFPVTGIVEQVLVTEGDEVTTGDILVRLRQNALAAERQDALSDLARARADRDELIAGPTTEARTVTATEVMNAREALERTITEEAEKVTNARRSLLSGGVTARAIDPSERATPPTVGGTYTCDEEGSYMLEVYTSSAASGYSISYSGLEAGTTDFSSNQPSDLGTCGLTLQFAADEAYGRSQWRIDLPNQNAAIYATNRNTYNLALEQQKNRVAAAREALALAEQQAELTNAAPRSEALTRADAAVTQAEARVARVDAQLADRVLRAPFAGVITNVDTLPGETVTTAPIITLLANSVFEVTARIPEIDIAKLAAGLRADLIFDARADVTLPATIRFISPNATEIDGVAYYEAKITLDDPPSWLRSGLNADVDIIVAEVRDVLRVPQRFIVNGEQPPAVLRLNDDSTTTAIPVIISFTGNDGFVAIEGVEAGTTIVAP